ncbi:MAG: hypothetical protein HKL85_06465 [Acidimicrobiaceae bacterium]|nr:hypothetical protein [Acidimicrobiaceae bacterium]
MTVFVGASGNRNVAVSARAVTDPTQSPRARQRRDIFGWSEDDPGGDRGRSEVGQNV